MAPWEDITPLGANGKPCPQRILVGEEDGGIQALRVLPDRAHYHEAWWFSLLGLTITVTPLALSPFVTLNAIPGIVLLLAAGLFLFVPAAWALYGETVLRMLPTHVSVQWRIGPLRLEGLYERHGISGIQLGPRTNRLLPMPMSCRGLIAAVALETVEGRRPILLTRAIVAEAAAAWLGGQLKREVQVEEASSVPPAMENLPVHESWREVAPEHTGWGTPQRMWTRRKDDNLEIALLTLPKRDLFSRRMGQVLLSTIASTAFMIVLPARGGREFTELLLLLGMGALVCVTAVLFTAIFYGLRGSRRLNERITTIVLSDQLFALTLPGQWGSSEASLNLVHFLQLTDTENLFASSVVTAGRWMSFDEGVTFRLTADITGTESELKLHPATAETLAQLIHEETGIPIEREYV